MTRKRRQHSDEFKLKVALEAVKELKTINEIASEHNLHPSLVSCWRQHFLDDGAWVFERESATQNDAADAAAPAGA